MNVLHHFQVIKDYEKAVIFRLGKLLPPKGPGNRLVAIILFLNFNL